MALLYYTKMLVEKKLAPPRRIAYEQLQVYADPH